MSDEERIKYERLYKNLYSIYTNYDKAIANINLTLNNTKKGISIDDKVIDENKLKDISSELVDGKANIKNFLKNIKEKIEESS